MSAGEKFRAKREEKGISQKQLADMLGVSKSMISQYENGKRNPKSETIRKIAAALECDISDLIDVYAIDDLDTPFDRQIEKELVPVLERLGYKINGRLYNGLANPICEFSISRDGEEKEVSSKDLYRIKRQTEEALVDAQRALFIMRVEEFIESIGSKGK